ncbi:hypothetical protein L1987_87017 [Smallanthus sonchifolius]|uniref:Uncharacterized protein n=1 Tax=Smallanthus sonchifolius TaxID=185202 RepID=A0ACB8Y568_9ASTR|nr:hypothetical protein L1987_87017 [Smallanthus sonchifolius]
MPRKKEPPPSALPPRRSARGLSRSVSSDADDSVELGVLTVGLGESHEGLATSSPPPLLHQSTVFYETNKEISGIPSVSLNASEQDLGSFVSEGTEKISRAAGKSGLARSPSGLSDSAGSPVVQSLYTSGGNSSCSMHESSGGRYAVAESTPMVTPLFSPEFKAMIGRDYPMRTVFSPSPALSGEATRSHGLWDGLAQRRSKSIGESGSLPIVHVPLSDVHVHVHAPEEGVEHGSDVHGTHAKVGTTLSSGIAIDEGVQVSTELGNGVHVSTEMGDLLHGGGDLPRPSSPMVEVAQDVGNGTVEPISTQSIGGTGGLSAVQQPVDTDMNMDVMAHVEKITPNQDVQSVWNSPSSGLESFANKIKKANEIEGLALEYFPPSVSADGCCRIHITQEDLKISAQLVEAVYPALNRHPSRVTKLPVTYHWKPPHRSHCVSFGHSSSQCSSVPIPMEEPIREPLLNVVPNSDAMLVSVEGSAHQSVSNARAPEGSSDGFTTYAPVRTKGNHPPAAVSVIHNNNPPDTSRNANRTAANKPPSVGSIATKNVSKGINFARAVQGDVGSRSQQPASSVRPPIQHPIPNSQSAGPVIQSAVSRPTAHGSSMEVDPSPICSKIRFDALNAISELDTDDHSAGTGMNFTELDIHASIKRASLVEAHSDLYPHEPMHEDGISPATFHSEVKEKAAVRGDPTAEKQVCQTNREHIEGTRHLPASILSSPNPGGLHPNIGGRTYGISESQRNAITNRLSVSSSICSEETVNWSPGEWDYFNDLCISMGLDPDYCIEDVESDTENGTAQFFSGLLKEGCPKPKHN